VNTIVSVTPLAVERDSRTFRIASSMTRLGYRSIVYEAEPSRGLTRHLPFELVTMNAGATVATHAASGPLAVVEGALPVAAHTGNGAAPTLPAAAPDPRPFVVRAVDQLAAAAPPAVHRRFAPGWGRVLAQWRAVRSRVTSSEPVAFKQLLASYLETCRSTAAELPAADLYYLHAQALFPAVWWRTRRSGTPFIYDAHDLYYLMRVNAPRLRPSSAVMWQIWDIVERAAVKHARLCVTVGRGLAVHAEAEFGRPFEVLHNGHDPRLDEEAPEPLRRSLGLDETALLVVVVGGFKPDFIALRPLFEALGRLPPDVHVAAIGGNYQEPRRWAAELGVGERFHVRPPVGPTQVVSLIGDADVAPILYRPVNADIENALPNKFFQGVAAGVPVLYSRHLTDLRRICGAHGLGWEFDPEDPASIASILGRLHADRAELSRRREHVTLVRDALAWPREEEKLARILSAAMAKRSS
jgi:hypothetical protein